VDAADRRAAGFARILETLQAGSRPVYLEIDPATSVITRLFIPSVSRVADMQLTADGDLFVRLRFSHARHFVRRQHEDFADMERALREALGSERMLIVTEDHEHNVINVRAFRPGPDGPFPPEPEPEPEPLPWPKRWVKYLRKLIDQSRFLLPISWLTAPSLTEAQKVFDALAATSCDPITAPAPCIPFLYLEDGCWTRAHEMCRLMINKGYSPRKVWIFGFLIAPTANTPACWVQWNFHVAPTLRVRGQKLFQVHDMVVDPGLFTAPVAQAVWDSTLGNDPGASPIPTDAWVYWYEEDGTSIPDPTYAATNYDLAHFRLKLLEQTATNGPPPFVCP